MPVRQCWTPVSIRTDRFASLQWRHYSKKAYNIGDKSKEYLQKSESNSKRTSAGDFGWLDRATSEAMLASQKWQESPLKAALLSQLDFRYPWEWYGAARANGLRTIHCHVGPTNSGKTHAALERLKKTKSGVYCAPLRLLAMEMWERLNQQGRPCALRTGEVASGPLDATKSAPFSSLDQSDWSQCPLLSCTVEMLDLNRSFDVAVIDEIQMMSDEQRGWAFTQALLGVNAKEIYVCGEEAAVAVIQEIARETGDVVTVTRYQRLSPLLVSKESLRGQLQRLQPGDCVVSFSRKRIFETKFLIETRTGRKCAVVYGKLPMENRSLQAKAFNEREDGYSVMVASDAVGMGLNLYSHYIPSLMAIETSRGSSFRVSSRLAMQECALSHRVA